MLKLSYVIQFLAKMAAQAHNFDHTPWNQLCSSLEEPLLFYWGVPILVSKNKNFSATKTMQTIFHKQEPLPGEIICPRDQKRHQSANVS